MASGADGDRASVWTARLLGIRDLAQSGLLIARPTRLVLAGGAAVDATHALTAYALAAADSDRRRPALTSAVIASGCAAVGLLLV